MSTWDDPDPLYPVLAFSPPWTPQPPTPTHSVPELPETHRVSPFGDPFRTPRPIPTLLTPRSAAHFLEHDDDDDDNKSVDVGPPLASSDDEYLLPIMATLGPKMAAAAPFPRSISRPTRPPVLPLATSAFTSVWTYEHSSGSVSPRTRLTPPPPGTPRRHNTHDRACNRRRTIPRRGSTGTFGAVPTPRHDDEHAASPPTSANLRRTASSSGYSRRSARPPDLRVPSGATTLAAPTPVRLQQTLYPPQAIELWVTSDEDVCMEVPTSETYERASGMMIDFDTTDFETTSHDLESVMARIRRRTSLSGYDGDSDDDSAVGHADNVQLLARTRCFVSAARAERFEQLTSSSPTRTSPRRPSKASKSIIRAYSSPSPSLDSDSVATAALLPAPVAALDVDLSLGTRPAAHMGRWRLAPAVRVPVAVSGRKDLSPRRKAQLLRRTRKIESILGKSLSEEEVEQYVVEPSLATTTVVTRIEQDVWPVEMSNANLPEWARDDCVPRRESAADDQAAWNLALALGHRRSRSGLARIRDLLSLKADAPPSRIAVALTRETRVAETHDRRYSHKPSVNRSPYDAPPSPETPLSPASLFETPAAAARRHRRAQLAKRLLGESPLTLGLCDDDLSPVFPSTRMSARQARVTLSETGILPPSSPRGRLVSRLRAKALPTRGGVAMERDFPPPGWHESNYMSAEEKSAARRRATKLEQLFGHMPPHDLFLPVHRRRDSTGASPPPSPVYTDYRQSIQSLIYLVEHDQERLAHIVDELDAAVATPPKVGFSRRKSMPAGLLSPRSSAPRTPVTPAIPAAPPCTPATPASHAPSHPTSHAPSSSPAPTPADSDGEDETDTTDPPPPSAHAVARARTRKLSDFFGEPVDAAHGHGHPHVPLPRPLPAHSYAHAALDADDAAVVVGCAGPPRFRPYPLLQGRNAAAARRRETLDGVLRELWNNVQTEAAKGGLAPAEARRLGDLWGTLGHKRAASGTWAEL